MSVFLNDLRSHLPSRRLTNAELCERNPQWNPEKIESVTGIRERRVAGPDETAGDLGFQAADSLLRETRIDRGSIDALLFCTQSPDYFPVIPATACVLQSRLGLSQGCAALDFCLGCSGFTYGLWLARALILSGSAHRVLLITSETVCRNCDLQDMTTVVNFGDGAVACLISDDGTEALAEIGPCEMGTDGRGAEDLIVRGGGSRNPGQPSILTMNGPEVFSFSLFTVHLAIDRLLHTIDRTRDSIDWYLMHQANKFLVHSLAKKMELPLEKVPVDIADIGNTSSASIPLLIERLWRKNSFRPGQTALLAGFGVGYSWGITYLTFRERATLPEAANIPMSN